MSISRVVTIGASAGGVKALQEILSGIPQGAAGVAYIIVIHMSKSPSVNYKLIYGQRFRGEIEEIRDKMEISPGHVYFAPADYHVLIEKDGTFALTQDEPVNFARPSIDVTFSSLAEVFGRRVCGALLTGSNGDGASGLHDLHKAGAYTLVQDPKTCEHPAMPLAALELFKPDAILNIPEITARISAWASDLSTTDQAKEGVTHG